MSCQQLQLGGGIFKCSYDGKCFHGLHSNADIFCSPPSNVQQKILWPTAIAQLYHSIETHISGKTKKHFCTPPPPTTPKNFAPPPPSHKPSKVCAPPSPKFSQNISRPSLFQLYWTMYFNVDM